MICTETSELARGDVNMSSILVVKKQKLEWKMWRGIRHLCVLVLLALSNFHNCGFSCDLSQRWLSLGCCEKEPRNCHCNNWNLPLGTLCSSSTTTTTRHYTVQMMGIAFWTRYVSASGEASLITRFLLLRWCPGREELQLCDSHALPVFCHFPEAQRVYLFIHSFLCLPNRLPPFFAQFWMTINWGDSQNNTPVGVVPYLSW